MLGHICFQTFANALVRTSLFITKPLAGTTNYLIEFNTYHLVEQDDFTIWLACIKLVNNITLLGHGLAEWLSLD